MRYIGVFANSFCSINNLSEAHFEWPYSAILSKLCTTNTPWPIQQRITPGLSRRLWAQREKKGFKLDNLVQRKIMPTIFN